MGLFSKLFGKKSSTQDAVLSHYTSITDFVDNNLNDIKQLLSSVGYNDRHKRLHDIAKMCKCNVVLLCEKAHGQDKFRVIEVSERGFRMDDNEFKWQYSQPTGANNAQTMLSELPFLLTGATSFVCAPVKNSKNLMSGLLLGLSTSEIEDMDSKVRLLHLLAPLFDADVELESIRKGKALYEQRILSLRQNIEIMTNDLKIEREKSAESKELKSIFLTNLSHEIRTPMTAISGFIDLMDTAESEEDKAEFSQIIRQNCDALLKVIDNLIEISKLQSGYMFKDQTPVQLNDLLTKIKNKFREKIKQAGKMVDIETSFALETPYDTIWNSEDIITKTLEQLMDNACKFTKEGKISFGYTIDRKEATFFVRDTGKGIRQGEEEKIFNMFGLTDNSLTRQTSGTGIGLSLARKYVELANGKIWCDTGYRGGACFYFTIPTEKL